MQTKGHIRAVTVNEHIPYLRPLMALYFCPSMNVRIFTFTRSTTFEHNFIHVRTYICFYLSTIAYLLPRVLTCAHERIFTLRFV
jgi:hypothetical protein